MIGEMTREKWRKLEVLAKRRSEFSYYFYGLLMLAFLVIFWIGTGWLAWWIFKYVFK